MAAHGDLQVLPETKKILPSEQDLPESISILRDRGRLERVAAFRQLQALSNAIRSLGHWQGLGDFKLPSDWRTVRPIEPHEVRVVRQGAMLDRALRVNQRTRQVKPILPQRLGISRRPSCSYAGHQLAGVGS